MPFQIVRNDITQMRVDAIVNSSNRKLIGAGGTDYVIHCVAGPEMDRACRALGGCEPGEAKATPGYRLPCKYVFHTVAPVWLDGNNQEREELRACYLNALKLAEKKECESIAFPLMSAGVNGFPRGEALRIAVGTIREWLKDHYLDIYLVVYDKKSFTLSEELYQNVTQFIDDYYRPKVGRPSGRTYRPSLNDVECLCSSCNFSSEERNPAGSEAPHKGKLPSADMEWKLDESFTQMLLRKIDEKNMTDSQCYTKANIDRKLFSKIRSDVHYHPSKITVLCLAIALELSLPEMEKLLQKAGYALSDSNLGDVIVKYFIQNHIYDIITINQYLFDNDQVLLYYS